MAFVRYTTMETANVETQPASVRSRNEFTRIVRRASYRLTLWKRHSVLASGLVVSACTDTSGPSAVVQLRTEIAPAVVAPGDTLMIRAILTNPTMRRLDVGAACGPPVLFEVRAGTGDAIYPIPLSATFTCERSDVHELEPGETDTVSTRWSVTAAVGQYAVRSGFRSESGLQRLTSPATLTIR